MCTFKNWNNKILRLDKNKIQPLLLRKGTSKTGKTFQASI